MADPPALDGVGDCTDRLLDRHGGVEPYRPVNVEALDT